MISRCSRHLIIAGTSSLPAVARPFSSTQVLSKAKIPNRKLRNNEIKLPLVHLVDPETQKLRELAPVADVISNTNMRDYYIELVSQEPPIVRLVNRKEAHAAKKAQKAHLKKAKVENKEVQMTWNVANTDVVHKLRKAREHLSAGNLVDVAFAPKPRQPALKPPEMMQKLELVREMLKDVAEERQPQTLERGVGVVYLRSLGVKESDHTSDR